MALTDNPRVNAAIERLCEEGCRAVGGYIQALQQGQDHDHFATLSAEDRTLLLAELRAIMAVYGDKCPVAPGEE